MYIQKFVGVCTCLCACACSKDYIYNYIHAYIHYMYTVGVKKKFRIPFRRTVVVQLKNGGKKVRRLLKNGRSIRPRYRFNLSRSPCVSLKNRLSNKTFLFFVYRLQRRSFSGLKKIEAILFEVVSRRIVSSTTAQYRRFLDVRAFSGLDFFYYWRSISS